MSTMPTMMTAVVVHEFGDIDQLRLEQVPVPAPEAGQVLVEVYAAGVGPWDGWIRAGKSMLHQPLPLTPGADISGVIVALGPGVDWFRVGQPVLGVTNSRFTGGYAQFALADAEMIAAKSPSCGFIEAAAVPVVAVTAWTMIVALGALQPGERVLIHGGAGNVGAFAIQFAKRLGARVITTGLAGDIDRAFELGADQVINVETTDFATACEPVDLVADTVGGDTQARSFGVLKRGGRMISSVSKPDAEKAAEHGVDAQFFIVDVTRDRLNGIAAQLDDMQILVGEVLTLADVRLAHEMLAGRAHKVGKIVLSIRQ